MKVVYTDTHQLHDPPYEFVRNSLCDYSECPTRAETILKTLQSHEFGELTAPREYPARTILAVHDKDYLLFLEHVFDVWHQEGLPDSGVMPDTFATRDQHTRPEPLIWQAGYYCFDSMTPILRNTYAAARASAHCALTAADLLLEGESAAYVLCRPPGHHAGRSFYGGYCYLNNAAIAAAHLCHKTDLPKVAVLDIDYHHGNGTQDIFFDSDQVLFVSIHADPNREFPFFCGYAAEQGVGTGRGLTRNFPLPAKVNDDGYLEVLDTALTMIEEFAPHFLVVSAGTDIHRDDPQGGFDLSLDSFTRMGRRIARVGVPTALIQEGGYNLEVIGAATLNFLRAFDAECT